MFLCVSVWARAECKCAFVDCSGVSGGCWRTEPEWIKIGSTLGTKEV